MLKKTKSSFFLLRAVIGEIDSTIIASLRIGSLDVEKPDAFLGLIQDLRKKPEIPSYYPYFYKGGKKEKKRKNMVLSLIL